MTAGTLAAAPEQARPQAICWRHPERWCSRECQELLQTQCLHDVLAAKKRRRRRRGPKQPPLPFAEPAP